MSWQDNTLKYNQILTTRYSVINENNMNKKLIITIDLTKDLDNTIRQIEEASEYLSRSSKKTLWQRIKSWF